MYRLYPGCLLWFFIIPLSTRDPLFLTSFFPLEAEASAVSTIVVRGSTDNVIDDIERALDDGINTFKALTKVCVCVCVCVVCVCSVCVCVCVVCVCVCAYMCAVYVGVSVPIVCVGCITKAIFMYLNVSHSSTRNPMWFKHGVNGGMLHLPHDNLL